MPRSRAAVQTAAASRGLQQPCKRFARKVAVDDDATRGGGSTSGSGRACIDCTAGDDAALARVHDVVGQHPEA